MNWNDLTLGGIEAVYALILGIIVVFLSYKIFLKITHTIDEEKEITENKNIAIAIALTAALITVGMIVKNVLYPSLTSIKLFCANGNYQFLSIAKLILYLLIYFTITILFAISSISLSAYLFTKLTKQINEMEELKQNNIAVAILFGGVIFTIGYFVSESVSAIVTNIIPYDYASGIQQIK